MLQKLRQYSKSWIAQLFLGLLTLSFVSWGIGDVLRGSTSTAVATVGGTKIERTEFQRDYSNFLRRQGEQLGKTIAPDEARKAHMGDALLQQTITTTAVDNVANKLGLTASDETVASRIRAIPSFAGISGAFDKNTFQQAISRYGYSEKGFIEYIRGELARTQLLQATEAGFALPPGYVRALLAFSAEVRAAEYVTVSAATLSAIAPPPDAVLSAYVKAHPEKFSTPEYRDTTYADIGPDDIASGIAVTDEQLRNAYENTKVKYVIDEKRTIERLTFPSQAGATAARAKIATGTAFGKIAEARGFKPQDIAFGDVAAKDKNLDPAETKAVFAVPAGGVTDPVKSAFGWTLFHVVKVTPGKIITFDQAKAELTVLVRQELARAKLDDISNIYTDAVSSGLPLEKAAQKAGMHSGHAAAVDKNGLAPDGSKATVPDDPEFRAQVFKAEVGEDGDPLQAKSGHFYVVQVNGVLPPKLKPLDAVRAEALLGWTNERRTVLLRQKAAELAAKANKAGSLATVAGGPLSHSSILNRETKDQTFSTELIAAVFQARPGTTVYGPLGQGEGYVVARVSGIEHLLPAETAKYYVQIAGKISETVGADVTTSFAYAAREKQGVKINNKLFDTVVGGGEGS